MPIGCVRSAFSVSGYKIRLADGQRQKERTVSRESIYLTVINNLSNGVYFVDLHRRITFWNRAAEQISGYTEAEVVGTACNDNLLCHIDEQGRPVCVVGCPLLATMVDGTQRRAEVFLRHKQGHRIPVRVHVFPIYEGDTIVGAAEIFATNSNDVYEDNLIEQLSGMAMRDALTNLPNRRHLHSFIEYKLIELRRFALSFALMFLDVDHFRTFNNDHGHDAGDAVLRAIADTVRKNTRSSDMFGRWGGEEFVGIYAIQNDKDIWMLAEKTRILIAGTEIPMLNNLSVTASIGITAAMPDDTVETIIERADHLMYASKQGGRNRTTCG